MDTEAIKQLATTVNKVAESVAITTAKQFQKQIEQLQAENKKLLAIIKNALVSLAIINTPCAEDNLANIATNEYLLKTMADSFREALKGQ